MKIDKDLFVFFLSDEPPSQLHSVFSHHLNVQGVEVDFRRMSETFRVVLWVLGHQRDHRWVDHWVLEEEQKENCRDDADDEC